MSKSKPDSKINRSLTQLRLPTEFDFDARNLSLACKRWKDEVDLYMDSAMVGKTEGTKIKLLLYMVGSKGREIYDTLPFEQHPEERSFKDVMDAFSNYCDPKKNETVERYKFFSRVQEAGETLEKFITDVKILAATCNFEELNDSLIRDRIICGLNDSKLR